MSTIWRETGLGQHSKQCILAPHCRVVVLLHPLFSSAVQFSLKPDSDHMTQVPSRQHCIVFTVEGQLTRCDVEYLWLIRKQHVNTQMHTHRRTHTPTHTCKYTKNTHTDIHMHTHAHEHTDMHTHTLLERVLQKYLAAC